MSSCRATNAKRTGLVVSVRHFHAREPAIAAAALIDRLPSAVVGDGPER